MKKVFSLFVGVLVIVVGLFSFVGYSSKEPLVIKESDTYIVINVSNEQMDIADTTTLVDYMNSLKDDGQLTFEITRRFPR